MTSPPKRRWLPRFGLRSMFVFVLVMAVYFGSWPWVEARANVDVETAAGRKYYSDGHHANWIEIYGGCPWHTRTSAAPYVIRVVEWEFDDQERIAAWRNRYYMWAFGWTMRLPVSTPAKEWPRFE